MELILASFLGLGCLTWSIYIRIAYSVSTAVCVDCPRMLGLSWGHIRLFEYEVEECGKKRFYQNKGYSIWYPKSGKKYNIFIKKNNPYKIVLYNHYAFSLILGIMMILLTLPTPIIG